MAVSESRSSCVIPFHRTVSRVTRSEEHTSELQSQSNLVCRLLLEKKNDQAHVAFSALEEGVEHLVEIGADAVARLHEHGTRGLVDLRDRLLQCVPRLDHVVSLSQA